VSLEALFESRFAIVPIASRYIKPSLTDYVQLALEKNVMRIVQAPELDLCTDPVELYHRSINAEETRTGLPSTRPRNLDADQVLQTDAHARAEYIQRRSFRV
jgi:Ras GTPase-activating-like protein IQGAP2/3